LFINIVVVVGVVRQSTPEDNVQRNQVFASTQQRVPVDTVDPSAARTPLLCRKSLKAWTHAERRLKRSIDSPTQIGASHTHDREGAVTLAQSANDHLRICPCSSSL